MNHTSLQAVGKMLIYWLNNFRWYIYDLSNWLFLLITINANQTGGCLLRKGVKFWNTYRIFTWKFTRKRQLGIPREITWKCIINQWGEDWMHVLNTVVNLRVRDVLTRWAIFSFSRKSLFYIVCYYKERRHFNIRLLYEFHIS